VFDCPELKIRITRCPKLEVLEGVPALDSLRLEDATMDMLPEYLRAVHPRYLEMGCNCNKKLYESSSSPGSSEWKKISHIGKRDIKCLED